MKENGRETKEMEKEKWFGQTVLPMRGIGNTTEYVNNILNLS